jgi:hypothetical protein
MPVATKAMTTSVTRIVGAAIADVLHVHGIADPEMAARDLAALTRGMIDAAGLFGETQIASLEQRVRRAVFGYLNLERVRF